MSDINFERIDSKLKDVDEQVEKIKAESEAFEKRKDSESRAKIAIILTWAFVASVGVIIVGFPLYNISIGKSAPIDILNFLTAFGAFYGTILGFVLGYFFKTH